MTGRINILVTGGAGYIGSHACKALAAAGYRPVAYDSLVRGNSASVNWGPLEQGDVRDTERLRTVIRQYRPAAVIHFAAFAYVGESMDLPLMCHDNNVGGTISLLKAMSAEGMDRLVFSSSCATYGIPASVPITESTPQKPINPYGRSKLMAEEIIGDACSGLRMSAVMLRYFNAAGADLDGEIGECHDPETHIVPLILRAAIRRSEQLTVFGTDYPTHDGTCIRDYVHVSDLADAHVRSVQYLEANKGLLALNLGSGNGVSIGQLITAAERVTGLPVPHRFAPRRQGDPPILVADATLARQTLGWEPRRSDLGGILESAWNWMSTCENLLLAPGGT